MSEIVVIIPDRWGLAVVDLNMLVDALADGDDLDTAITNAAMDSLQPPGNLDHIERIRQLNATGNVNAYWEMKT